MTRDLWDEAGNGQGHAFMVSSHLEVVTSEPPDVVRLSRTMRESDRVELETAFGRPADVVLLRSFLNARECWSVRCESRTIAMFGVGRRADPVVGTVWLLSSEELFNHGGVFLRTCGSWVERMMCGHDVLSNYVHARNEISIRWLKWLRFEFLELRRDFNGSAEDFWLFAKYRDGISDERRAHLTKMLYGE